VKLQTCKEGAVNKTFKEAGREISYEKISWVIVMSFLNKLKKTFEEQMKAYREQKLQHEQKELEELEQEIKRLEAEKKHLEIIRQKLELQQQLKKEIKETKQLIAELEAKSSILSNPKTKEYLRKSARILWREIVGESKK